MSTNHLRNIAPLPLEDWILQVVPESFWVNDLTGVQDPVGLEAQRLAVTAQIYSANYFSFRNLARVFETLEFNLKGYFPKTLLLAEGVLNGNEREGEVLVVDFSDESTHLVLVKEGKIAGVKSLPLGSHFLTSGVAKTWDLSLPDARRLKERYGSLASDVQYGEELIPLGEREGQEKRQIKRAEFHQAFLGFGNELFGRIEQEVKDFLAEEKGGHAGFILTGGGAKLEGVVECLTHRLSRPVRLGTPRQLEAPSEVLMDPAWAAPVGLVRWLRAHEKIEGAGGARENLLERVFFNAKEFLAAYF
jgi:cell division protein FtsA